MVLHILFQGRARDIAGKLMCPSIDDFRVGGQLVLPVKGDRVTLRRVGSVEGVWLRCTGRRFDFNEEGEPILYLGLDVG
jgi:hypothetical protein